MEFGIVGQCSLDVSAEDGSSDEEADGGGDGGADEAGGGAGDGSKEVAGGGGEDGYCGYGEDFGEDVEGGEVEHSFEWGGLFEGGEDGVECGCGVAEQLSVIFELLLHENIYI